MNQAPITNFYGCPHKNYHVYFIEHLIIVTWNTVSFPTNSIIQAA